MVTSRIVVDSPAISRPKRKVGSLRLDPTSMTEVIERIEDWIRSRTQGHTITLNNLDSAAIGIHDAEFRDTINQSSLALPDGMPLVWFLRWKGCRDAMRVCGPELFTSFFEATQHKPYRHFFYGGADGVADSLSAFLQLRFPSLSISGTFSPPFRPLTPAEDDRIIGHINECNPDIVWVGLGCPKQELWMAQHRQHLRAPVLIGVGQVFDIYSGRTRRAPAWMCSSGLEWLFRLQQEPARLWRRYLLRDFPFLFHLIIDDLRLNHSQNEEDL